MACPSSLSSARPFLPHFAYSSLSFPWKGVFLPPPWRARQLGVVTRGGGVCEGKAPLVLSRDIALLPVPLS
jgi:hypothetical protein